jgi:hypothetical protein
MVAEPTPELTQRSGARGQRWLVRAENHQPFAYARGHDFFRSSDHALWAHLSDDRWLLSARSGAPIAYRTGNYLYDAETHTPLFYERS